jgi:hypothetical protein
MYCQHAGMWHSHNADICTATLYADDRQYPGTATMYKQATLYSPNAQMNDGCMYCHNVQMTATRIRASQTYGQHILATYVG